MNRFFTFLDYWLWCATRYGPMTTLRPSYIRQSWARWKEHWPDWESQ